MNNQHSRSAACVLRLAFACIAALVLSAPAVHAATQAQSEPARTQAATLAQSLQNLYADTQERRLWRAPGRVDTALELLRSAPEHGLDARHYDVDALTARHRAADPADADAFDQALSQAMLRFLHDLHAGRVKPDYQLSSAEQARQQFDPAAVLRQALEQDRLAAAIEAAAPALPLYRRVRATLSQYRKLAALAPAWTAPVGWPADGKLVAGRSYAGLGLLRERLHLLGDLDADPAQFSAPDQADADLAPALKRFQARHGLPDTGLAGRDTLAALAVPLSHRVRQLELTLERLRWLPPQRPGRIIVVNVAAYRLWALDTRAGGASEALEMRVIVGKAARTQTPLFIGQMSYLEFNPYWNVPSSIAIGEIAGKIARNPSYLAENQMELVTRSGQVVDANPAAAVSGLRNGSVRVRQRPGQHNVLGAVKFAMPNPMNIYLHSTSAKELFGKSRRDLSHGCIRVERPQELARFVLGDQAQWSATHIETAMAPGATRTVRLSETIPVILFYATAVADRGGRALFAADIYRRDDKLAQAMAVH